MDTLLGAVGPESADPAGMVETETALYATGGWECLREALPADELTIFHMGAVLHPDPWQSGVQMLIEHEIAAGRVVEYVDHHPEESNAARLGAAHAPVHSAVDPRTGFRVLTFGERSAGTDPDRPKESSASRRSLGLLRVHDYVDGLLNDDVEGCWRVFGEFAASAQAEGTTTIAVVYSDDDDLVWQWRQESGDHCARLWQEWTDHTGLEEDAWTSAAVVNYFPPGGGSWGGMAVALADDPGLVTGPAVEALQLDAASGEPSGW